MICHSEILSAGSMPGAKPTAFASRISFVVGNVETKADVIEWADDVAVLSVDDPSDTLREHLFVAQLMSWIGHKGRRSGTLQALHPTSTGKFRLHISWRRSIDRLGSEPGEMATLCAC